MIQNTTSIPNFRQLFEEEIKKEKKQSKKHTDISTFSIGKALQVNGFTNKHGLLIKGRSSKETLTFFKNSIKP